MITMTIGSARILEHAIKIDPLIAANLENTIKDLLDPGDIDAKAGEMFEEVVHLEIDGEIHLRLYYRHDEEVNEYQICGSLMGSNWAIDANTMSVCQVPETAIMQHQSRAQVGLPAKDVLDLEILGDAGVAIVIAPEPASSGEDALTTIYMLDHRWSLESYRLEGGRPVRKDT